LDFRGDSRIAISVVSLAGCGSGVDSLACSKTCASTGSESLDCDFVAEDVASAMEGLVMREDLFLKESAVWEKVE